MMRGLLLAAALLVPCCSIAQMTPGMDMKKPAAVPSTTLTVTLLDGTTHSYSPEQFKALQHVSVSVHNAHNNHDETYSGVPVATLVNPTAAAGSSSGSHASPNVQVIIAGATDNFHVVITMCDANPQCRSGQAIVADQLDGQPLGNDGAFKLVLTEDKKPARWARNLSSLTVKAVN